MFSSPQDARHGRAAGGTRHEDGFILLAVLFLVALILITLAVAAPKIAKAIQRDRELELVHRGEQYKRAVKLYYRKFGAYPSTIDQLVNTNQIRFLRKRYTDPMTGKDDWKIIHQGEQHVKIMGLFGQPIASSGGPAAAGTSIAGIGQSGFGNGTAGAASGTSAPSSGVTGTSGSTIGSTGGSTTGSTTDPGARRTGARSDRAAWGARRERPRRGRPGSAQLDWAGGRVEIPTPRLAAARLSASRFRIRRLPSRNTSSRSTTTSGNLSTTRWRSSSKAAGRCLAGPVRI